MSQYRSPHQDSPIGSKPMKDIFSYYPPQSSYESPKKNHNHNHNYKPVYMEVPRKPLDVLENPHQYAPYVLPAIRDLLPKDFNHGHHQKAYLKVTSFGQVDPKAIRPVGHIKFDKIRYLHGGTIHDGHLTNHLQSHDAPRFPPIANVESNLFVNNKQLYSEDTRKSLSAANILKGTPYQSHHSSAPLPLLNGKPYPGVNQQYVLYQQPKSTNAAPYYTKAGEYQQQSYASAHPVEAPHSSSYPTTIEVYPEEKYTTVDPTPHSDVSKDLVSNQEITEGLTGPVKIVRSKKHPHTIYAIGSPKIYLAPGRYQYSPYEALTNSYMPKVLDHFAYKSRKSGKRYLKPSIVHDTPTVVDREVSIVHVPVEETYVRHGNVFPDQIEAHSAPKSSQVQNNKHKESEHPSNTHFFIDDSYRQHGGHSEEDVAADRLKETDSIYVGTKGLDPNEVQKVTDEGESIKDGRQFFHAYYAPSDHVPPKGYTKMSVDEFKSLFQNAEIQYLPRKQADELRLRRESVKRND